MVFLAFLRERKYCCWYFIESCLLFVCCCTSRCFPQFCEGPNWFASVDQLQSEQIFHYIHVHVAAFLCNEMASFLSNNIS